MMAENQIDKTSFFEENFSVDGFLTNHTQKATLNDLRQELTRYVAELHTLMTEILRTETDAIVNLADNMTQINAKIVKLYTPISQFREEILTINNSVLATQTHFEEFYNEAVHNYDYSRYIKFQKQLVSHMLAAEYELSRHQPEQETYVIILRRAIAHIGFLKQYLTDANMNTTFMESINNFNAVRLDAILSKALENNSLPGIEMVLKMYKDIGFYGRPEEIIREAVVRPAVLEIFKKAHSYENVDRLGEMYAEAVLLLNRKVVIIHDVIDESNGALEGFNFVVKSFWCEVDKALEDLLPNYTAPGNPELFQKRFISTWSFLEQIHKTCIRYKLSFDEQSFQAHIKCFNLPVYYEIRYQQISGKFETVLARNASVDHCELLMHENDFKLAAFNQLWNCYQQCFSRDVFIEQLTNQFLKLSLLLVSRMISWLKDILEYRSQVKNFGKWESFYVNVLLDLRRLKFLICGPLKSSEDTNASLYEIIPGALKEIAMESVNTYEHILSALYKQIENDLVAFVAEACNVLLHQITSIPRIYRRTNREVPMQPSNYALKAVEPVTSFYESYRHVLFDADVVLERIVANITSQYSAYILDVMHSVGKIEESLRRLKHRTFSPSTDETVGQTDESKIKEQIKLDVEYFVQKMRPYVLNNSSGHLDAILHIISREEDYAITTEPFSDGVDAK